MKRRLLALFLTVCAIALSQTGLAGAQIIGTTGGIVQIAPPASLMQDQLASDTQAFAFDELQDVTLSSAIPVDITQPGLYDQPSDLTNSGVLAAGMVVDSHMVHSDKPGSGGGGVDVEGTVVVDNDIVGIQVVGTTLDAGDGQLGFPGTIYPTGFEQRQLALSPRDDFIIEQMDRRTVFIHFNVNAHVDEVRIITESEKRTPDVTSQVHDSAHNDITGQTVPVGTEVHDKAIVTGSGPTPTGTVDFARFTNADCSGDPVATENDVALAADGTAESSTFMTVAGDMAYRVHYDGDSAYEPGDGPCEPLHVAKRTPNVTSQVHDYAHNDITGQTVSPGTQVHDKAIVTGSGPTPTGTVDFARFTNADCSGTPVATQNDVALAADGTAESSTFTTVLGNMAYKVHYDGDATYDPADGPCEPLFVKKKTPNVKTEVHDKYTHKDLTGKAVDAGTWVHDKAIVTGSGPTPTGTVDFFRYSNANCSGYAVAVQNNVALVNGTAESSNIQVWGDISYKVHYDGDANYEPADGVCEPLFVEKKGCEGCSAYYWKTHTYKWVGVSPSDSFETIFGRDVLAGNPTMLQVLSFTGGGIEGLAREAAAAYISARHPGVDYPLTSTELIWSFQYVIDSGNSYAIDAAKLVLAYINGKNCPLYW